MNSLFLSVFLFVGLCLSATVSVWLNVAPQQVSVTTTSISQYCKSGVTVSLATDVPVAVCFQEFVYLMGDLASECNGAYGVIYPTESVVLGDEFVKDLDIDYSETDSEYGSITFSNLRSTTYYVYFQNLAESNSSVVVRTWAYISYQICNKNLYGPSCQPGVSVPCTFNSLNPSCSNALSSSANYYTFSIPLYSSYFIFSLIDTSLTTPTDVTFYARRDAPPTTELYDVMGTSSLNLTNPIPGTWYLYFPDSTQIRGIVLDATVINCGALSIYVDSVCVSINATNLTTAYTNVTSVKSSGKYDYYVVTNSTLILGVGTSGGTNIAPPIFTSTLNVPDNTTYMLGSTNNTVNFFFASAIYTNNTMLAEIEDPTWIVAVWSDEDYVIWANQYCPKNCSSKGNCTEYNGTCSCNKGYKGLYCQNHGLPLIVIILIAIGAAIILAIVIGVPVACYIRNSRKSYSRV